MSQLTCDGLTVLSFCFESTVELARAGVSVVLVVWNANGIVFTWLLLAGAL